MSWWEDEIASHDGYGIRPAHEDEPHIRITTAPPRKRRSYVEPSRLIAASRNAARAAVTIRPFRSGKSGGSQPASGRNGRSAFAESFGIEAVQKGEQYKTKNESSDIDPARYVSALRFCCIDAPDRISANGGENDRSGDRQDEIGQHRLVLPGGDDALGEG